MYLCISGFLPDDNDDDSLKLKVSIPSSSEKAVMDVLGWNNLAEEADGELPLTAQQANKIASIIKQPLPDELELFIGVRA